MTARRIAHAQTQQTPLALDPFRRSQHGGICLADAPTPWIVQYSTVQCKGKLFQLSDVISGVKGRSVKLLKPRCRTTVRQNFFSLRVVNRRIEQRAEQTLEGYGRLQLTGYIAHQRHVQVEDSSSDEQVNKSPWNSGMLKVVRCCLTSGVRKHDSFVAFAGQLRLM